MTLTPSVGGLEIAAPGSSSCDAMQTFTATLTGMAATTTGTADYWICSGDIAILYVPSNIFGTSNATSMNLTGLPSALQPATTSPRCNSSGEDDTVGVPLIWSFNAASGTVNFLNYITSVITGVVSLSTTSFTSSGSKGLEAGATCIYQLF